MNTRRAMILLGMNLVLFAALYPFAPLVAGIAATVVALALCVALAVSRSRGTGGSHR